MTSQTTIGRYEVLATLGQGAMGTVYKAVDPVIERTVAIKTINLSLSKEERAGFEERFYREAKSAGRLNHANIVTIYDVGETGELAYIAMEYLEGESLREVLDSGVVLPIGTIGTIAARVARALRYAHENGVVHRDIKPANIMITPGHDVKIMDFGIAQIPTGSRTQLGTVLGSPKYMAPEQVKGQPTDGRTDIFALGVVLYEMLTGTTPFNGDNLSAIMYKILHEDPAPPSTINPQVPPAFDRIVSRALAKRPDDRYQSAGEFARDLWNLDAVPPQATGQKIAGERAARSAQRAGKRAAGPEDATVLLAPHEAGRVMKAAQSSDATGTLAGMALQLRDAPASRKLLLAAMPLLAIAVLLSWPRGPQRPGNPAPVPAPWSTAATGPGKFEPAPQAVPQAAPQAATKPAAGGEPARAAAGASARHLAPAAASEAAPEASATVSFAISPWGEVWIDGTSAGVSPPLTTLELQAGKHRVEVRNPGFSSYRNTLHVEPGQSLKIRHKFR